MSHITAHSEDFFLVFSLCVKKIKLKLSRGRKKKTEKLKTENRFKYAWRDCAL